MGFVKSVTWGPNDVAWTVVKPDVGKPWTPTTAHFEQQRRVRKLNFIPGSRNQRKNNLFVKGCECTAEDVCRWCVHFHFRYNASGLAEAAAQHRVSNSA